MHPAVVRLERRTVGWRTIKRLGFPLHPERSSGTSSMCKLSRGNRCVIELNQGIPAIRMSASCPGPDPGPARR
jgi:hypothetical protein